MLGRSERCSKESWTAGCNVQKIPEIFSWDEAETWDCSCNHGKTGADYLR